MEAKSRYVFDLAKMMSFVFDQDNTTRNVNSEIIETYDKDEITNELDLASKVMREVKDGDTSSQDTIRYDLLKLFIQTLLGVDTTTNPMSLGESVIINTLLEEKLIKEVEIKSE